jgi:hypothetical protein
MRAISQGIGTRRDSHERTPRNPTCSHTCQLSSVALFPSYAAPPNWVGPLVALFAANRAEIDSAVTHAKRMESNES